MKVRHCVKTPLKGNGKKIVEYSTQCDLVTAWTEVVAANTVHKVTCPDCLLALMTKYESKIVLLEEQYERMFPNRPVGERLQ